MVALAILFLQIFCGISNPTDTQVSSVTTQQCAMVQTTPPPTTSVGVPMIDPNENN